MIRSARQRSLLSIGRTRDRDQHRCESEDALTHDSNWDFCWEERAKFTRAKGSQGRLAGPSTVPRYVKDSVAHRPRKPMD